MQVKGIRIGIKRNIRLARYNVSECEAELTAHLDEEDDLEEAYKELLDDVDYIVEDMKELERKRYKKEITRNAEHKNK
jgi:ribosomal protein S9